MTDLSSLGDLSLGVWTRQEALSLLTPGEVDVLVRGGVWQVLWRGVYTDGGVLVTAEQRAVAAVLAVGGQVRPTGAAQPHPVTGEQRRRRRAVACGRTAARVWQLPLIDDDDPATAAREHVLDSVSCDRRLPRQAYGGRLLVPQQLLLAPADVVQLDSGLWVTSALRTLVDCALVLSHEALVCAIDDGLHRRVISAADLQAAAAARRRLPGGPALRAAVELSDGRSESPNETLARLLLLPVLPGLEPQVRLFDERGWPRVRFDLGDRQARLAVEADGKRGHAGAQMVAKDRARDRWAEDRGWRTERVTWFELRRKQQEVVRRMVALHAERMAQRRAA